MAQAPSSRGGTGRNLMPLDVGCHGANAFESPGDGPQVAVMGRILIPRWGCSTFEMSDRVGQLGRFMPPASHRLCGGRSSDAVRSSPIRSNSIRSTSPISIPRHGSKGANVFEIFANPDERDPEQRTDGLGCPRTGSPTDRGERSAIGALRAVPEHFAGGPARAGSTPTGDPKKPVSQSFSRFVRYRDDRGRDAQLMYKYLVDRAFGTPREVSSRHERRKPRARGRAASRRGHARRTSIRDAEVQRTQ